MKHRAKKKRYSSDGCTNQAKVKGEHAEGTGHITINTMNLLHLDQNTRILPQLKPNQISMPLELPSKHKEEVVFQER